MIKLGVNVDHTATLRQARGIAEPDPVTAALQAELAGADGITIHLREDRRHIQDRDLTVLRQTAKTRINLEMAATDSIINIALREKPDIVCLVPEKRQELTTEGGLDVAGQQGHITAAVGRLQDAGIPVSLFIDADENQIGAAAAAGARFIELHTGRYADAGSEEEMDAELEKIRKMTGFAIEQGLRVNAGHGLNYRNVQPVAAITAIEELNIGHSIIARAVFDGLAGAVREMKRLMMEARGLAGYYTETK